MDTQTTCSVGMTPSLHSNQLCHLLCSAQLSNNNTLCIINNQLLSHSNQTRNRVEGSNVRTGWYIFVILACTYKSKCLTFSVFTTFTLCPIYTLYFQIRVVEENKILNVLVISGLCLNRLDHLIPALNVWLYH